MIDSSTDTLLLRKKDDTRIWMANYRGKEAEGETYGSGVCVCFKQLS